MTRKPLASETSSPSPRALEIAATDTVAGHLRNALTILAHAAAPDFPRPLGVPAAATVAYDRADVEAVEARIWAALTVLNAKANAAEITPAGRAALWPPRLVAPSYLFEETADATDPPRTCPDCGCCYDGGLIACPVCVDAFDWPADE